MASQSPLPRILALVALPLLSLLGYYSLWYLGNTNGTFGHIHSVLIQGTDAKLPGTNFPLLRQYTGIAAVDSQLVVLVTFFAHVVDGTIGGSVRWGMGQFGAAWCVMLLEGLRAGNKGKLIAWVGVVGVAVQLVSFAVATPLWLFLHILTSPVAKSKSPSSSIFISASNLNVVPLNICLSYLLPCVLMGFPSPKQTSPQLHQLLIALWQPFPLWTVILQPLLPIVYQYREESTAKPEAEALTYLNASKYVYTFALVLCMGTHISSLYSSIHAGKFLDVFIPLSLTSSGEQVPNLAEGVKNFLQWDIYIGVTAFLVWSLYLYANSFRNQERALGPSWVFGVRVAIWAILAGPMGVVLLLLGARDEVLLREGPEAEKKEN